MANTNTVGLGISNQFNGVAPHLLPQVNAGPSISAPGGYIVGQDITVTEPTWQASPTVEGFWTRDGVPFASIGATTRTLAAADQGKVVGALWIATNSFGQTRVSVTGQIVS